jgi:hypothetical protein
MVMESQMKGGLNKGVQAISMLGVANAVASIIRLVPLPAILFGDPVFKTRVTPVLMDYPLRQSMRISQTPVAPAQAPAPIEAWVGCGLRLLNTDGVCARTTDVYRDETLHESDARCSNCERQIQ